MQRWVFACVVLLGLTVSPAAFSETVTASESADVRAAPGEQSQVVARVKAGKTMDVLQRQGRWIKVRVNGRTGWVTRTVVEADEEKAEKPKKRKKEFVEGRTRGKKSKSGPKDRVGADAVEDEESASDEEEATDEEEEATPKKKAKGKTKAEKTKAEKAKGKGKKGKDGESNWDLEDEPQDAPSEDGEEPTEEAEPEAATSDTTFAKFDTDLLAKPSANARPVASVKKGDELTIVQDKGEWLKVENSTGDRGWISAEDVGDAAKSAGGQSGDSERGNESASADASGTYVAKGLAATAGLGYASFAQNFSSTSTEPLGNYKITAGRILIGVGVEWHKPLGAKLRLMADGGYQFGKSSPGITVSDGTTQQTAKFATHDIDLGANVGYQLGAASGLTVYARLGYHFGKFVVSDVSNFAVNIAKIPSEVLSGAVVGTFVDVPKMTSSIGLRAGVNALLLMKSRKQTEGLEDGADSSASAYWAWARLNYSLTDSWTIFGNLGYYYAKTKWAGIATNSMRVQADEAVRKDGSFSVLAGIYKTF